MLLDKIVYLTPQEMTRIIVDTATSRLQEPCQEEINVWFREVKNIRAHHVGTSDRLILRRLAKQAFNENLLSMPDRWIEDYAFDLGIQIAYLEWPAYLDYGP